MSKPDSLTLEQWQEAIKKMAASYVHPQHYYKDMLTDSLIKRPSPLEAPTTYTSSTASGVRSGKGPVFDHSQDHSLDAYRYATNTNDYDVRVYIKFTHACGKYMEYTLTELFELENSSKKESDVFGYIEHREKLRSRLFELSRILHTVRSEYEMEKHLKHFETVGIT